MRMVRSSVRLIAFLGLCISTSLLVFVGLLGLRLRGSSPQHRQAWIQKRLLTFFRRIHRAMGMRITWDGEMPTEPCVLMGNHRSYVDAILFPVSFPVVYVARVETKSWPIIGWGANLIGTLWVDRKDKSSRRKTRQDVRDRLDAGMGIVIFPEGTTHKGPDLLPYRPGMFYTCAEEGFPIVPVAIEYKNQDIAWVGQDLFVPHAFHHFGAKTIDIRVRFGPTMTSSDPESLLHQVQSWTEGQCLQLREELDADYMRA
ncbi:MAG: 1-acyl-sn-glycerol-3-phosphate acyltransferase [Bacteroidota bacterium]|jgi:1-acyl-sn-glycerol-3-phosphate acyltransferase